MLRARGTIVSIAVGLVLTACGGGDTTPDPPGTTSGAPTTTAVPGAGSETTTPTTSMSPPDSAAPAEATSNTHPSGAASVGTAHVSVGDLDYEFVLIECELHDNGSVFGAGDTANSGYDENRYVFTGSSLTFRVQAEGSEVGGLAEGADRHFIRISDNDEALEWNAGADPFLGSVTAEHSNIQDWTQDGTSAAGTASFIEEGHSYAEGATPESAIGEFQITCR